MDIKAMTIGAQGRKREVYCIVNNNGETIARYNTPEEAIRVLCGKDDVISAKLEALAGMLDGIDLLAEEGRGPLIQASLRGIREYLATIRAEFDKSSI